MPFYSQLPGGISKQVKKNLSGSQGENDVWRKLAEVSINGILIEIRWYTTGGPYQYFGGRVYFSDNTYIERQWYNNGSLNSVLDCYDVTKDQVTCTKVELWGDTGPYAASFYADIVGAN
jgi:hypothetical protein